jgi:hypothetical protein
MLRTFFHKLGQDVLVLHALLNERVLHKRHTSEEAIESNRSEGRREEAHLKELGSAEAMSRILLEALGQEVSELLRPLLGLLERRRRLVGDLENGLLMHTAPKKMVDR